VHRTHIISKSLTDLGPTGTLYSWLMVEDTKTDKQDSASGAADETNYEVPEKAGSEVGALDGHVVAGATPPLLIPGSVAHKSVVPLNRLWIVMPWCALVTSICLPHLTQQYWAGLLRGCFGSIGKDSFSPALRRRSSRPLCRP
jgi:hypothetical protein